MKRIIKCCLIGMVIWIILGVLQHFIWDALVTNGGYFYGIVPGCIIGLLIGLITAIFGLEVGLLAGCIIACLGNFFNVATLSNPLPVDIKTQLGTIRLPIFVAIPGGILGALSSWLINKLAKSEF